MSSKDAFMRELEKLGFTVGNFGTSSQAFYDDGGFDISAEDDPGSRAGREILGNSEFDIIGMFFDYYGEFRGGYPFIHPKMEELAEDYGYYFEWYNAGSVSATPEYFGTR